MSTFEAWWEEFKRYQKADGREVDEVAESCARAAWGAGYLACMDDKAEVKSESTAYHFRSKELGY